MGNDSFWRFSLMRVNVLKPCAALGGIFAEGEKK
jgi:hypothetical protein